MRKSRTIDAPEKASSRRQQATRGARGGSGGGGVPGSARKPSKSGTLFSFFERGANSGMDVARTTNRHGT